jgi:hypothetical protein
MKIDKPEMTVRQYAAIRAMQGLLASGMTYGGSSTNRNALARDAIAHADALLDELSKGGENGN